MKLLLSPKSQAAFDNILRRPHNALCITGPVGSGKESVAQSLSKDLVESKDCPIMIVRPNDNSVITIDKARDITHFFKLKSSLSSNRFSRIVIVVDAHTMNEQTQNALLKTLEELPPNSAIILTAPSEKMLLPTIMSRVHTLQVHPVTYEQAFDYFKPKNETEFKKHWLMSEGRVGLLDSLQNNSDHPLLQAIQTAKKIITEDTYSRLCMIDTLTKQQDIKLFSEALMIVCKSGLHNASPSNMVRWHRAHKAAYNFSAVLNRKPNLKLNLTNLMLTL